MERTASSSQTTDINTAWTGEEDQIQTHGHGSWPTLRPDLRRGNFGEDEEDLIIKLHALLGDRWSLIAGRLPGRTDVEVQNYWNSHIKSKLRSMGIDPQNHRPRQHLDHAVQSRSKEIHDHETSANSDNDNEQALVPDAGSIN